MICLWAGATGRAFISGPLSRRMTYESALTTNRAPAIAAAIRFETPAPTDDGGDAVGRDLEFVCGASISTTVTGATKR